MHDVDNRLKYILDAAAGALADQRKKRTLEPIIPNDRQIYRVIWRKDCRRRKAKELATRQSQNSGGGSSFGISVQRGSNLMLPRVVCESKPKLIFIYELRRNWDMEPDVEG